MTRVIPAWRSVRDYPQAWAAFQTHYADSNVYSEDYWLVFLTGYLAAGFDADKRPAA